MSEAKAKEDRLRQQGKQRAKEEKLAPEAEKELIANLVKSGLSDRERKLIDVGISNLEFHYLGSAKILGGIGKGLAEAMIELHRPAGK